jgi:hypothetical protein
MGEKHGRSILLTKHLFHACKVFLHAVYLRHGTDCFTSPPKEGVLRILSPLKSIVIGRVLTREPWVQWQARKPLDHRGRPCIIKHTVIVDIFLQVSQTFFVFFIQATCPTSVSLIEFLELYFLTSLTNNFQTPII